MMASPQISPAAEPEEQLRQALATALDSGFAAVVRAHERVVYSVALRLNSHPADAEDLAAKTFLRALLTSERTVP